MALAACANAGPLAITVAEVTVFDWINSKISSLSALSVARCAGSYMFLISPIVNSGTQEPPIRNPAGEGSIGRFFLAHACVRRGWCHTFSRDREGHQSGPKMNGRRETKVKPRRYVVKFAGTIRHINRAWDEYH